MAHEGGHSQKQVDTTTVDNKQLTEVDMWVTLRTKNRSQTHESSDEVHRCCHEGRRKYVDHTELFKVE